MRRQFRHSTIATRETVIAAALLTVVISFLVWLVSGLFGARHPGWIALVAAGLFFTFCSAATLWRYARREVVLSVQPGGLFDARLRSEAIPWDDIKELVIHRTENEYGMDVVLWPDATTHGRDRERDRLRIDLAGLDAPPGAIVGALPPSVALRMERA